MEINNKLLRENLKYPEYKLQIIYLTEEWQKQMNLGHYIIENTFLDITHPNDESIIAETTSNWQYLEANINWYMDKVITLRKNALERTVVHELSHVLISPMENQIKKGKEEYAELAVESIARALMVMKYGRI
ncbi:hypothetical protein EB001_21025 [bacterium]|nr:hypothetical protein [bacterium]